MDLGIEIRRFGGIADEEGLGADAGLGRRLAPGASRRDKEKEKKTGSFPGEAAAGGIARRGERIHERSRGVLTVQPWAGGGVLEQRKIRLGTL